MEVTRKHVVEVLRRMGHTEAAEGVLASLPERMDLSEAEQFLMRYGITRDALISQMGGSP